MARAICDTPTLRAYLRYDAARHYAALRHTWLEYIGGDMLQFIYKILLSLSATSWFALIFIINNFNYLDILSYATIMCGVIIITIAITKFALWLSTTLSKEAMNQYSELELVDNNGMPIYLGYFFVAISIQNTLTAIIVYFIIFIFTMLVQSYYYNPLFLLFKYHFYKAKTINGVQHNLIIKGNIIRSTDCIPKKARRINDISFITEQEENQ